MNRTPAWALLSLGLLVYLLAGPETARSLRSSMAASLLQAESSAPLMRSGLADHFAARPSSIAASGPYTLVGAGRHVLVYSTERGDRPHRVGRSPMLAAEITALAANERLAVVGGWSFLAILDMRRPERPYLVWRSDEYRDPVHQIAVEGNLLYVFSNLQPLIYDISKPAAPRELGKQWDQNLRRVEALDLDADGGLVLAAAGESGLWRVASNGRYGRLIRTQVDYSSAVRIHGNRAFVASGAQGLRILDLSDPERPVEWPPFLIDQGVEKLALVGDLLYVSGGGPEGNRLWVVDVGNGGARLLNRGIELDQRPHQLEDGADRLAALSLDSWSTIQGVNLVRPAEPLVGPALDIGVRPSGIAVDGLRAYVIGDWRRPNTRLMTYTLGGEHGPEMIGWIELPDPIWWDVNGSTMAASSGHLLISTGGSLHILSADGQGGARLVGSLSLSTEIGSVSAMTVLGHQVYFLGTPGWGAEPGSSMGRLVIVDWSDAQQPQVQGSIDIPTGMPTPTDPERRYYADMPDLEIIGDQAWVIAYDYRTGGGQRDQALGRLLSFDISDPSHPALRSTSTLPESRPGGLSHHGEVLALSYRSTDPARQPRGSDTPSPGGFEFFDLRNEPPLPLASIPWGGCFSMLESVGDQLYGLCVGGFAVPYVAVIDMRDPFEPVPRWTVEVPGRYRVHMAAGSDAVFVADHDAGISVIRAPSSSNFRALMPLVLSGR